MTTIAKIEKVLNIGNGEPIIRIVSAPEKSWPNPYVELFYEAISEHNIKLAGRCPGNDHLLRKKASQIDAIHLHWPEGLWRYAENFRLGKIRGLLGFWCYLRVAHRCRLTVVWTVHNLEHHEGISFADRIAYRLLAKHADLLICHSQGIKKQIVNRWHPGDKIVVMHHGNYDGIYPKPLPRERVIKELALNPGIPIVSCVGSARGYKGIDIAIKAIKHTNMDVQLIIAGEPHRDYNVDSLLKLSESSPKIRLILHSLSTQELADILNISDAVLLPYQKITGSGAFMLAMTLGRGVIASDLPYFREMLAGNDDAGVLFEPGSEISLSAAITKYLLIPADCRQAAARKIAQEYSWDKVVKPVAFALRQCVLQKQPRIC